MSDYDNLINQAAEKYQIPYTPFKALIMSESGGKNIPPRFVADKKGGGFWVAGPGQIIDSTAKRWGVKDFTDPSQNIDAAAQEFKFRLNNSKGNIGQAVGGYKGITNQTDQKTADTYMAGFWREYDKLSRTNSPWTESVAPSDVLQSDPASDSLTGQAVPIDPNTGKAEKSDLWERAKTGQFISLVVTVLLLSIFSLYQLSNDRGFINA